MKAGHVYPIFYVEGRQGHKDKSLHLIDIQGQDWETKIAAKSPLKLSEVIGSLGLCIMS